jgi:hypothetical protein
MEAYKKAVQNRWLPEVALARDTVELYELRKFAARVKYYNNMAQNGSISLQQGHDRIWLALEELYPFNKEQDNEHHS